MTTRTAFALLFAVTIAVYAAIVFWSLPQISQAAGGLVPFDLRPMGYAPDEARALLDALGEQARGMYLGRQHWLDTAYPGLLMLTLAWATLWSFRDRPGALRLVLIAPAVVGAGFDYIENMRVAGLLRADIVTDAMIGAASFATIAKSVATTLAMVILLVGLGLRVRARWRAAR